MKFLIYCSAVALLLTPIAGVASASPATADVDALPLVSSFTVSTPTMIPGEKLSPGTYSIRIVDHLADRIILRVENASGKVRATFLGLENSSLRGSKTAGTISWAGGESALRGFTFPGGGAVEFVYPKSEAVEIAKSNSSKVPAIDPVSDGRLAEKNLSKDDMQMVTLWMLSSTPVGPDDTSKPAIAAERYQAPPQQMAQNVRPKASQSGGEQGTGQSDIPQVKPVAKVPRKPVVASLPHTASELPLILLAGIVSLLTAVGLRFKRTTADAV